MASNVRVAGSSVPVRDLDRIGPGSAAAAKAALRSDQIGPASDKFGPAAWEALERHYGSVKAAAISLGNVDASLLRREVQSGDFRRIEEKGDDDAKAAIAEELRRRFPGGDPKEQIRRAVREARRSLDRVEELIA